MFKTISAALLAVSVLAAPALAATSGKTETHAASVTKQSQVKSGAKSTTKSGVTTGGKTAVKPNALNANAKMGGHHVTHHKHYQHLSHHKTLKTHTKVSFKQQSKPTAKRG